MVPTVVLVLVAVLSTLQSVTIVTAEIAIGSAKAVRRPNFDNKKIKALAYTLKEFPDHGSDLMCLYRCGIHVTCASFAYNIKSSVCMLYSVVFHGTDDTYDETGWEYYIASHPDCPTEIGYVQDRQTNLCVYISPMILSHTQSMETCENMTENHATRLVSLDTASKISAMKRILTTLNRIEYSKLDIGLTKDGNTWYWTTGSDSDSGAVDWQSGQPYCTSGTCSCAYLVPIWDWRWDDSECEDTYFACEYTDL